MSNIVSTGMKIDLHIHSCFSSKKDGKKVKNNTLSNLPILIRKLNENAVNICSITDHDYFSYDLYTNLKLVEKADNSIKKVLPGVEFSVVFNTDTGEKTIHIVTIFSDIDDEKIKNIEKFIKDENKQSYKEVEFLDLLRKIDLDTILIAHQKNSLLSNAHRDKDAASLGDKAFYELIHADYFESFEFKNKRNEIMNKSFIVEQNLENEMRFVTGTDCHDWTVYPKEDPNDSKTNNNFPYTYAKCLPTFKGLVLAMTETTRLKLVNSFFNGNANYVKTINLAINKNKHQIELSKGINVIIGDNSIGKSLLLHAITNYKKSGMQLDANVKRGYKKYLKDNNISVTTKIDTANIFQFDMQGEVRHKFEDKEFDNSDFINKYMPTKVDPTQYINIINSEIDRMISYLENKFDHDNNIKRLKSIKLFYAENKPQSLSFNDTLKNSKITSIDLHNISNHIQTSKNDLDKLIKLELSDFDKQKISDFLVYLNRLNKSYDVKIDEIENENGKKEKIATAINAIAENHDRIITDEDKDLNSFRTKSEGLIKELNCVYSSERKLKTFQPFIKETLVTVHKQQIQKYDFISKFKIDEINTKYFNNVLNQVLKKNSKLNWENITLSKLKGMLSKTSYDESKSALVYLKEEMNKIIKHDLSTRNSIIFEGKDKYSESSSGLDAQMYFDILSYEKNEFGLYVIDQPEDNISQKAIRTLLKRFKTMSEYRQVIIVTHNPQFIVNLDVDNVIYISKDKDKLNIVNGALEYQCGDYSILDIVANNIDGGLRTIKNRWKKYEKTINDEM